MERAKNPTFMSEVRVESMCCSHVVRLNCIVVTGRYFKYLVLMYNAKRFTVICCSQTTQ